MHNISGSIWRTGRKEPCNTHRLGISSCVYESASPSNSKKETWTQNNLLDNDNAMAPLYLWLKGTGGIRGIPSESKFHCIHVNKAQGYTGLIIEIIMGCGSTALNWEIGTEL